MKITDLKTPPTTPRFTEWEPGILDAMKTQFPDSLLSTLSKGNLELTYSAWYNYEAFLDNVVPGWQLVITSIHDDNKYLSVVGYLEIYGVRRYNVGWFDKTESGRGMDSGPPMAIARSSLLRRCSANFGLGRYLYFGSDDPDKVPQVENQFGLREDQYDELSHLLETKDIPKDTAKTLKDEKSWTIARAAQVIRYLRRCPDKKKPTRKPAVKKTETAPS